jgi:hypothetical protein
MTGTADTEAYEFQQIYGLETVVIPTHRPMVRKDMNDLVYKTADEKHAASLPTSRTAPSAASRCWSAPPRSKLRAAVRPARQGKAAAPGAQRQAARPRSRDRRPGRPSGHDHHCHQHGRSRYRHRAGRQHPEAGRRHCRPTKRCRRPTRNRRSLPAEGRMAAGARTPCWRPAACTSSVPSATNRAASTTSCAAAPVARAMPVRRASTCRSTTAAAHLRRRAPARHHGQAEDAGRRGHRASARHPFAGVGAAQGRGPQLRHPQAVARI